MLRGAPQRTRGTQACVICHKKKVKCDLTQGNHPCTNCRLCDSQCRPRERKRKRYTISPSPPPVARWSQRVSQEEGSERQQTSSLNASGAQWPLDAQNYPSLPPLTSKRGTRAAMTEPVAGPDEIARENSSAQQLQQYGAEDQNPGVGGSYVGRSEYLGGDVPFNEDMAEAYPNSPDSGLSETDMEILRLQRAFDLPPRSIRTGLIDAFKAFCAPWTPIVNRCWLEEKDGSHSRIFLLQAVFLAGSRVSSAPLVFASCEDFYRRAKALFFCGHEKDTIISIVAVCLLHWWHPNGPEQVSTDTSGFWVRIGVSMAHQVGLHREPPRGKNRMLRRRLWWSLVARDSVISAGTGRPRAINIQDSDVQPPSVDDFAVQDGGARLFIAYVTVCQLLGDIVECRLRKKLSRVRRTEFENALYRWVKELPPELRLFQPEQGHPLNTYNFEARQLLVPYFVVLVILHRSPIPDSLPSAASLVASSFISGIFEDFLARDELRYLSPAFVFYAFAAGLSHLSGFRYPSLRSTAEHDFKIIQLSLQELSKRWGSASGPLRAFSRVRQAVSRQPQLQYSPPAIPADALPFFNDFGPDLCREWHLLPRKTQESIGIDDQPQQQSCETMTATTLADLRGSGAEVEGIGETILGNTESLQAVSLPRLDPQREEGFPDLHGTDAWSGWDDIGSWLLEDWGGEGQC